MDTSSLISAFSAAAAIASAIYAHVQARHAKESVDQAKRSVSEASTQNRINAIIALKDLYEEMLPEMERKAKHFSASETYESVGKPLYEECEKYRKKLQRVNAVIDGLYESYVPGNVPANNG